MIIHVVHVNWLFCQVVCFGIRVGSLIPFSTKLLFLFQSFIPYQKNIAFVSCS